ncbi:MAG: hypothetical protein IJU18_07785, partial [Oscillospiraceae bacterium]|nr:hypothetical protein [Oscillospiraceae bacterium]
MKKKALWIIVAAAVVALGVTAAVVLGGGRQSMPGHGNVDEIDWYDPQGTEYVITDVDMLYDLITLSYHYDFAGQTIKLGADIAVNTGNAADWEEKAPAIPWRPIQQFAGTFDGQGHTISGLYANTINTPTAMFNNVDKSAVIRDFRLENSLFLTAGSFGSAAIATNFAGTYQRIYTDAVVRCSYGAVGGLLSMQAGNASVTECWFDGEVETTYKNIGGIADRAYGAELAVRHCLSTGKVIDLYKRVADNAGGLVGMTESNGRLVVEDCFTTGEVEVGNLNRSGTVVGGGDGTSGASFINTFTIYERPLSPVSNMISNRVGGPIPIPEKYST